MTAVIEPTLFDEPHAAPVDAATAALLALIHGDPIHTTSRQMVVEAIVATARENEGLVDPNVLRVKLTDEHGKTIPSPHVVGPTIAALRHQGVLRFFDYVETTGSRSGNSGRMARRYRVRSDVLRDIERAT